MAVHNVKGSPGAIPGAPAAATSDASKTSKSSKASAASAYAKASASPNIKDAANVQISPRAKEMSLARKIADETPDVNEAKVEKYKNMIAKGEYKPDAGKIADGIARDTLMNELATNK